MYRIDSAFIDNSGSNIVRKDREIKKREGILYEQLIENNESEDKTDGQLPTPEELQLAEWEVLVSTEVTNYRSKDFSARLTNRLDTADH